MAAAQARKSTAQERKHWDRKWIPYVLLAPAIITILVIIVSPLLTTIYYSFSNIDLIRDRTTFVGFDNYVELFSSRLFWKAVEINLKFAAIVVAVPTLMGLFFALLLVENFMGRSIGRTLLILPWALPWIVVGLLWNWVVNAQFGALNGLLYSLGFNRQIYSLHGERAFGVDIYCAGVGLATDVIQRHLAFGGIADHPRRSL